ncbi:MAG: homospermidine synthase, partial [Planctomycetia bacterium]|nr:homospermidine synthase [Planctomycetia bacterium]
MIIRDTTQSWGAGGPTAIITHGANPGWVSHATKIGIRDWIAYLLRSVRSGSVHDGDGYDDVLEAQQAVNEGDYARAAALLNIQVIHIAERDTQISRLPKQTNEFVNTWSPMGFIEEGTAPAELGWGTHETLQEGVNHHRQGPKNQVYFDSMGMNTLVKSWVPSGDIVGMVVRHEEAFSISEHLTYRSPSTSYRPTVHYCYYSCSDSIASLYEMQSNNYEIPKAERVMKDDIISGKDELGVFM